MTMMSDLSQDLVEEILSRVLRTSLGAVRSTCKLWNRLSKNRILCNAGARHQILGFTMMDHRLYSMRFNLHGIGQDGEEFIDPSIKPIGNNNILDLLDVSKKVFYCDGLILLCVTKDDSGRLVVWNPYLGQTRWIHLRNDYHMDATYALGYDNNKNHKISRFFFDHRDDQSYYQTYDLNYNSWSLRHAIPNWAKYCYEPGVSVNGNTYFRSYGRIIDGPIFIVSFDFTTERFRKISDLPFRDYVFMDTWTLSCVRGEKLAVLYQCWEKHTPVMEIWMTIKIEPNAASWSRFVRVDMEPSIGFDFELTFDDDHDSFFIDEEKKVVVIFSLDDQSETSTAYIIGDNNRYLKTVDLEKVAKSQESVEIGRHVNCFLPFQCSSSYYVPSLVQINQITGRKRKQKKRKHKRKDDKSKRTNKPVPGKKKTNY